MGACASVPKAKRAENTNVRAPEPPREEETSATAAAVTAVEKAEGGNIDQKEAAKVEAPKEAGEIVTHKSKMEAPPPLAAAAALEEEKITPVAEQKN